VVLVCFPDALLRRSPQTWFSVKAYQKRYPNASIVIYTGDSFGQPSEILDKVKVATGCCVLDPAADVSRQRNWNLDLADGIEFVRLRTRDVVEAAKYALESASEPLSNLLCFFDSYPYFTMLGQSIGSMFLAWEAMIMRCPDVLIGMLLILLANPRLLIAVHGRHNGICLHLPRVQAAWPLPSCDVLRPLSYHQHR
jgi:alpha-1,2-mannosyltransferase